MKVTLYSAFDFEGEKIDLSIGRHAFETSEQGLTANKIGSLQIPDGLCVSVFSDGSRTIPDHSFETDTAKAEIPADIASGLSKESCLLVELRSGQYYQLIAKHSNKALQAPEGVGTPEKIVQNDPDSSENQLFEFIASGNGYYQISCKKTKAVLSVNLHSGRPDNELVVQLPTESDLQKWLLIPQTGDGFEMVNKQTGKVIDVYGNSKTNHAELVEHTRNNGDNQRFLLERIVNKKPVATYLPLPDHSYRIYNVNSNKPFGAEADGLVAGTRIEQQEPDINRHSQLFIFEEIHPGLYKLRHQESEKYLSIEGGKSGNGDRAVLEEWTNGLQQLWRLKLWEDGNLSFTVLHSGKALDVNRATTIAGEKILQWTPHEGANQRFTLKVRSSAPKLKITSPEPACISRPADLTAAPITAGSDPGTLAYFRDEACRQPLENPAAVSESGTYFIQLTDEEGFRVSESVEVVIHPLPKLAVIENLWTYPGEPADLTAPYISRGSDKGELRYFRTADPGQPLTLAEAAAVGEGTYYIQLTVTEGCSSEIKAVTVARKDAPAVVLSVHLDARYIPASTPAASPRIDFSRLPFHDGEKDINPYTPYLGEELESVPFKNGRFELQKGIHLHWTLPRFLTTSFQYPMLDLSALRRATRTNEVGEPMKIPESYDKLFSTFIYNGWEKEISDNPHYDAILAGNEEKEKADLYDKLFCTLINKCWIKKISGHPYYDYILTGTEEVKRPDLYDELLRTFQNKEATEEKKSQNPHYTYLQPIIDKLKKPELYDELFRTFIGKGWIKEIFGNTYYASILAGTEEIDVTISEMLADTDTQHLGQEILRVRSLLEPGGTQLPPVPNRWRVIRTGGNAPEKTWTVESNFLKSYHQGNIQTGIPFPDPDYPEKPAPFGWLGRRYEGYRPPEYEEGGYLTVPLTALGYGEPTFAAFYPNCHSVFGFYDETAEAGKTYTYEIYGYYGAEQRSLEYFDLIRKDLSNRTEQEGLSQVLSDFLRKMQVIPGDKYSPDTWPGNMVCCGRATIAANEIPAELAEISVTIGSNSTEAVSAYLADALSADKKNLVEEYLESLQYLRRLEHLQTDIGSKLDEERHRQSFTTEKGGYRWVMIPRPSAGNTTEQSGEQITLTDEKAAFLHELNEIQLAFDRADEEVKALRRQIFADWSKYMLCQYPPDGADDEYPDADQARFFIESELIRRLEELNEHRQQKAKALRDHVQAFWHFEPHEVRSASGLYAAILNYRKFDFSPFLNGAIPSSEEELIKGLNRFIDLYNYHDPIGAKDTGVHTWTLDEILERQFYQTHLVTNRRFLENLFPDYLKPHPDYILQQKPHRTFHRPADPVILLTGDALKTSLKYNREEIPKTRFTENTPGDPVDAVRRIAEEIIPQQTEESSERHPLLLDWLVEFFPVEDTDFNLDSYEPDYLTSKYELPINAADFKASAGDLYSPVGQTFWGSSLLAASGAKTLKKTLETFLIDELGFNDDDLIQPASARESFLRSDPWITKYGNEKKISLSVDTFDQFYDWYPENLKDEELRDLWTCRHKVLALFAYEKLNTTHFLSQALGGFTPALLMLREGFQLDISDPLGYPEYQEFSQRVQGVVGLLNHASTLPNNPFFPIRAGAASLLEIRLLDTFGQEIVHVKNFPKVIAAETMAPQHSRHHFELSPRLSQAARLNFSWLSASDDRVEHNEHPASSPVCGWMLINRMDQSLMIYDGEGKSLGYLDRKGRWASAPGQRPALQAEGIRNWHLRRMVLWFMKKAKEGGSSQPESETKETGGKANGKSETIPHLIALINEALLHVEPPRGDHAGEGVAMLISRPLALVRATASLEIKGLPAVNQNWKQFRQVIENPAENRESTLDLENVTFPLRIGEDDQLNDGLVGFWEDEEDSESYRNDCFCMPSLHRLTDGNREYTDRNQLDLLTIGTEDRPGKTITFNMLIDPHGSVHASCGILPVRELSLPTDIYKQALEQLEVSFLTAPLLTPREMIHLSLPDEPGFQWSWLDTDRLRWREVTTTGHFRKEEFLAAFGSEGTILWEQLMDRGWIIPDGDRVVIVPPDRRPPAENFPPAHQAPFLEHFMTGRQINPFRMTTDGGNGNEIREGWLRLRPLPELPPLIQNANE